MATTKVRPERRSESAALSERLLDVKEASSLLGLKPRTLYKMAYAGRLPVVKIGRASRFRLSTLQRLIEEWERPSTRPFQAVDYYH